MTHTNPLIAKWEELHNPKKEEPKKVVYEIPAEIKNLSITPATNKFNQLFERFGGVGGDNEFLRVADKIQKGEAKVVSTSMNLEHFTKSITFEVQVYT